MAENKDHGMSTQQGSISVQTEGCLRTMGAREDRGRGFRDVGIVVKHLENRKRVLRDGSIPLRRMHLMPNGPTLFIAVGILLRTIDSLSVTGLKDEPLELSEEYCSTGPPGRYCLKDLSGYYDCRIDPKTGTYIDKIHSCKEETRCGCYYGPKCPQKLSDPCVAYVVPPEFPQSYLLSYTGEKETCTPLGCITTTYSGIRYQDTKNKGRFREDTTGTGGVEMTVLIFSNGAQYNIDWDLKSCKKSAAPPLGPFQIPHYYSFNGKELVNGVNADRWHWFEGAHNSGEGYLSSYIYATYTPNQDYVPVKIYHASNYGPPVKQSTWWNETTGEFKRTTFDDSKFKIPSFCKIY
eukprot:gene15110-16666_t